MIVKQEKTKSKFLEFMLFQEADDEPPKRNRKVISLKAGDGRRPDLSQGAELEDEEEPEEDTGTEEDLDNEDLSDGADIGDDTPEDAPDEPEGDDGAPADAGDEGGEDEDLSAGADIGDDDTGDQDNPDEEGDDGDTGDEGGEDEDLSAGADIGDDGDAGDDASDDDGGGDTSAEDSDGEDKSSDEQIRKYTLYKKFLKLNKLLTSNCELLNNVVSDDPEINRSYKTILTKLKEVNSLLSEYMIIRFQNASYIQSMLFYQRVLMIVNINFNALSDLQKVIIKNSKV